MTEHTHALPADLPGLRAMLSGLMLEPMEPTERAQRVIRIARAALVVARTQGAIVGETVDGLTDALAAVRAELEVA